MVLASCSKRCLRTGSHENSFGRIFRATMRSSRVSVARYTSPMPPAPRGETTSYGPSLWPGARDISDVIIALEESLNPAWASQCLGNELIADLILARGAAKPNQLPVYR